ncbi:SEC-C metal-binding domain-containing protein [Desulfurobacterium atlanticum]|uniref:SEC-C motif-containing protein n=1 Tax=Desulfurobacterium atlanticum TaxID=240169 RepID=A0A238YDU8_9BACT|nr:SEC-C domain-containing protein [Desulfurobacterium atlanticum]SNR68978.1 SEC-C motif-containing protein [Desulfurobacterium atlanticum]
MKGLININNIDCFEVEIEFNRNFPRSVPVVKEIGGDIPRDMDRHIDKEGRCCLTIPSIITEELMRVPSILNFMEKFVEPFFANRLYYEKTGMWLSGEYSHGKRGILDFLTERLFIKRKIAAKLLEFGCKFRKKSYLINWNKPCPCGSGKVLKKCHKKEILEIIKLVKLTERIC